MLCRYKGKGSQENLLLREDLGTNRNRIQTYQPWLCCVATDDLPLVSGRAGVRTWSWNWPKYGLVEFSERFAVWIVKVILWYNWLIKLCEYPQVKLDMVELWLNSLEAYTNSLFEIMIRINWKVQDKWWFNSLIE